MKTVALVYMAFSAVGGAALLGWALWQGERQKRAYAALRRDVTGRDTPATAVAHILHARAFRRPDGRLELGHKVFGATAADCASHLYDAYCLHEAHTL